MKVMSTKSAESARLKIVVAGEAGNGKTTLARTIQEGLGERVLVISAEAGLLSLKGADLDYIELQVNDEGQPVPKEKRIARLAEVYNWLMLPEQMAKYRWIFLDSLTEISQNMLEQLETIEEFSGPKNTIKKYGELATRMRSLAKSFRDMPHYSVVFSALVKEETDQDNQKKVKVSLIGSFADQLPALFDEVLYLGVTKEVGSDGRNVRMLLTQKTDLYQFPKDRDGALDRMEPADLSVIVRKLRSAQAKKPLVADISAQGKEAAKMVADAKAQNTVAQAAMQAGA